MKRALTSISTLLMCAACGAADAGEDAPSVPMEAAVVETHMPTATERADILAALERVLSSNNDIGAVLLECTELSPHAVAVQNMARMPVWDYTSLTNWIYSGCVRRPFVGHI